MWNKLKNLLLYGGTTQAKYIDVTDAMTESNRSNMLVFSGVVTAGMLVMVLASFFDEWLVKNRAAYVICMIISVVLFAVEYFPAREKTWITYVAMYVFIGLMFAFGIALGTFLDPTLMSVSFVVIMFAAPLLFTDSPLRMIVAILVGILAYIWAASVTQEAEMFSHNMSNVLPYGFISMVVSTYMMEIKISRYVLELENRMLIELDQMTGMMNRRCYEQHIARMTKEGCRAGTKVCALDINGLKAINDNIGHQAGDELIRGAAECIESVFRCYGKCYRTGGDEFMAILEKETPAAEELIRKLDERCSGYHHGNIRSISVSAGIVESGEGSDINQLVRDADKKMYEAKAEYYERTGIERRKV